MLEEIFLGCAIIIIVERNWCGCGGNPYVLLVEGIAFPKEDFTEPGVGVFGDVMSGYLEFLAGHVDFEASGKRLSDTLDYTTVKDADSCTGFHNHPFT